LILTTNYALDAIELIFDNAFGLSFADGAIFVLLLMALMFSIQDFRIGLMCLFIFSIGAYIFYTLNGFSVTNITIMVFVSILLMAVSLFLSKSGSSGQGVIG